MRAWKHLLISSLAFLLASCIEESSTDSSASYGCTLPCLQDTPSLSTREISAATGGDVHVVFDIRGDITNVADVTVMFVKANFFEPGAPIGSGYILSPTQAHNDMLVTFSSGIEPGTYYPLISFTAVQPGNSGNEYYIDPSKSGSIYTYVEVVSGRNNPAALTGFAIPTLRVY